VSVGPKKFRGLRARIRLVEWQGFRAKIKRRIEKQRYKRNVGKEDKVG